MTEILQPETEKLIARKCQEWQCATLDDTIREAFQRIEDYENKKTILDTMPEWTEEELDAELQKGLDSRKSTVFDEATVEHIKARGRKRLAAQNN